MSHIEEHGDNEDGDAKKRPGQGPPLPEAREPGSELVHQHPGFAVVLFKILHEFLRVLGPSPPGRVIYAGMGIGLEPLTTVQKRRSKNIDTRG